MRPKMNLNSLHLNYLTPLLKWRVMDLESLRKECFRVTNYKNFHRIIRNLEKEKILDGYRDPHSRKKFVFLSPFGEGELSLKENPTALSSETLIHDLKVSEITRSLLTENWIDDVELEHQIHDKRNFKLTYKIIPDAILYVEKKGHKFQIAFELELTRKSNQRLIEKMKQYEDSSFYHYVMYLFPSQNLMEKYIAQAEEILGKDRMSKFMFFCHPEMSSSIHKPEEIHGVFQGKKISLGDVFQK
jgi:hypothetical protein